MNDVLRDHNEFADALCTLFDADVANGGTDPVSSREQVIDRIHAVLYSEHRDTVDLFTLARAMLATYEATLARIANREGAKP